ncbi:MAG: NAD-glutamate dehydrogenase [Acidobacteria bacterium]|nr:NAD-glutamate dehydrogenase [Acidobacteriota bacterium]
MITVDPERRASVLAELQNILQVTAAPGDGELLAAFTPVTFAAMPDSLALQVPPAALADRIREAFTFVARTMTPPVQLYKGLPGLHVSVRNPPAADEVTIIETHTPDAPFIFESLKNYLQKEGLRVFSAIHPIFTARRQWERVVWLGGAHDDGSKEVYTQFRVERVEAKDRLRRIEHQLHAVLKTVFLAVEDFPTMTRAVRDLAPRLRSRRGVAGEAEAARAFVDWLLRENYVLIGMLHYNIGSDGVPHADQDSALGVFEDPDLLPVVFPGVMEQEQAHIQPADHDDRIIDIDYCTNATAIHHLDPVDDIVIREWGVDGSLASATLMLGRLAKGAFTAKAEDMPLLADKLAWIRERSGTVAGSHVSREMRAMFNRFPKRELFYSDVASLKDIIERVVDMSSDDEIVVTTRQGAGYRALCIAFSDLRYSHKAEEDLKRTLATTFGPISFNTWADCGVIALLLFYFDESTLERPIDVEKARAITAGVITTWEDHVAIELEKTFGPLEGRRLYRKYVRRESRSGLYRESTPAHETPEDIRRLEQLEDRLETRILPDAADTLTLKLFSPTPLGLTDTLRTLQNLGLMVRDEMSIPLTLPDHRRGFLSRLRIEAPPAIIRSMVNGEEGLRESLRAMQERRATDCPLNGLILAESLQWREVEILRTLRNHLLQIRTHYTADTVNGVLLRNSQVTAALFRLFAARFDPAVETGRSAAIEEAEDSARRAFESVGSLLDDEILRAVENLIQSALRTNVYQRPERPVFSIKVDSSKVEGMTSPRPMFEVYVHSRALEGIHLRGGRVARGGIRWSDRHDDFRTEVLGLMNTQMLKNSIIVPVPPRPALDQYLVERYREFVSGLLDVTDNLVGGRIAHPPDVVRHDGDDPYLVVAADKGTAHLSDTANSVSAQYGFWLGDAFASGGSNGYDHKREAITARGAWECVKEHFRNLGVDVQTEPFTMAGIGDMSGDVFGNGALRSRTTRLVAAFNHQHILLDPNPEPESTFAERARLFGLPRSTWRDYDTTLISPGGGIFDRSAKAIPLGPEARALLDIPAESASGEEVVRRILTMKVDLLYNGGIGTYVKASSELHSEVGDRSSDRVRVDGKDLRARVVAEGGNLGFTQKGRIEFWAAGGLINTDAVDNSGGVDMSDHEVNIKILLDLLVQAGMLKSRAERNAILREMTDEVSDLVLRDNEQQARCLTLDGLRSAARYGEFVDVVEELTRSGVLSRVDDDIPTRDELAALQSIGRGLPRPLLGVVLGRVKNWTYTRVLQSPLVASPAARRFLDRYFPERLRQSFAQHFGDHPLRNEIIATAAVNYLFNNAGVSFIPRLVAATRREVSEVVLGYLEADHAAGGDEARTRALAAGDTPARESQQLLEIEAAIEKAAESLLTASGGSSKRPLARTVV